MVRNLLIFSIAVLAYLVVRGWEQKPITHPPGVLVDGTPLQVEVQASNFGMDDYQITKKARFEIHARVLSTEQYYLNREADLSPIDLALGWGVMSDQSLLEQIDISQSSRWYRWRYEGSLPVSDQQIITSSGNMHMIPATASVERSLMKLREGDVVVLQGYLVDVDHDSGWRWRTSMTRTDTGAGACEIVYVESIAVGH
jgi:hypothetical protein